MTEEKLFKTYEKELKEFEDWISQNPRLPKNINKLLLLRFLKVYDFDVEAAKKLLVYFLEFRKKNPNMYQNRDLLSEEFQRAMSVHQCVGLRKTTKENHKITIFRIVDKDASKFSIVDVLRMITAMLDVRLIYCDENELIDGEISIADVSNFSFRHFTNIIANFWALKTHLAYTQEAAPIKIIQSHLINCPPIMEKLMSAMKPFMKKHVWESIKIHSSMESLYKYIPKENLPVDYGGTEEPLDEYFLKVKEFLERYRDYLACDDNWKIED